MWHQLTVVTCRGLHVAPASLRFQTQGRRLTRLTPLMTRPFWPAGVAPDRALPDSCRFAARCCAGATVLQSYW